jgi:hypothetical protein
MTLDEIRADDNGRSWIVKFVASSDADPSDDDWWRASITVIVGRISGESIESLTERARVAARNVVDGLSKT